MLLAHAGVPAAPADASASATKCTPEPAAPQQGPNSGLNSSSGGTATGGSSKRGPPLLEPALDLEALPSDWAMQPGELEYLRRPDGSLWQLGSGGFGMVYKARRHGVQPVAVKVLRAATPAGGRRGEDGFKREIAILRGCRDANILQFVVGRGCERGGARGLWLGGQLAER